MQHQEDKGKRHWQRKRTGWQAAVLTARPRRNQQRTSGCKEATAAGTRPRPRPRTHRQDHEDGVDLRDGHGVQVGQHVAGGDAPLQDGVLHRWVEEVGRRDVIQARVLGRDDRRVHSCKPRMDGRSRGAPRDAAEERLVVLSGAARRRAPCRGAFGASTGAVGARRSVEAGDAITEKHTHRASRWGAPCP